MYLMSFTNFEQQEGRINEKSLIKAYQELQDFLYLVKNKPILFKPPKKKGGKERLFDNLIERAQFNPKYPEDKVTSKKSKQAFHAKVGEPTHYFFM